MVETIETKAAPAEATETQNNLVQGGESEKAVPRDARIGREKKFDRRFSRNKMARRGDRRGVSQQEKEDLDSQVIIVRRVTRVVKGGKKMRFSALVVAGDRKGRVGYAIRKGVDFQAAVNKATRKAQQSMIKIAITQDGTLAFPSKTKFKAAQIFLKPAKPGTGLIAGGYLRPVLELAGVQNIYTKIMGGRNKISGVQCALKALQKYSV